MGFPMNVKKKKKKYMPCVFGVHTPWYNQGACHAYEYHQSSAVSQLGYNAHSVSLKVHSPVWG